MPKITPNELGSMEKKKKIEMRNKRKKEYHSTYFANSGFSVLENRSAKLCKATAVTSPDPK